MLDYSVFKVNTEILIRFQEIIFDLNTENIQESSVLVDSILDQQTDLIVEVLMKQLVRYFYDSHYIVDNSLLLLSYLKGKKYFSNMRNILLETIYFEAMRGTNMNNMLESTLLMKIWDFLGIPIDRLLLYLKNAINGKEKLLNVSWYNNNSLYQMVGRIYFLFSVFSRKIEKYNRQLFISYYDLLYFKIFDTNQEGEMIELMRNFDYHYRNRFTKVKECMKLSSSPSTLRRFLIQDDVNSVILLNSFMPSLDIPLSMTVFERYLMMNESILPIYYAAFYGSLKCFKFILLNSPNYISSNILKCLIYGGNLSFYSCCNIELISNHDYISFSINSHQFDFFKFIIESSGFSISKEIIEQCLMFDDVRSLNYMISTINEFNDDEKIDMIKQSIIKASSSVFYALYQAFKDIIVEYDDLLVVSIQNSSLFPLKVIINDLENLNKFEESIKSNLLYISMSTGNILISNYLITHTKFNVNMLHCGCSLLFFAFQMNMYDIFIDLLYHRNLDLNQLSNGQAISFYIEKDKKNKPHFYKAFFKFNKIK